MSSESENSKTDRPYQNLPFNSKGVLSVVVVVVVVVEVVVVVVVVVVVEVVVDVVVVVVVVVLKVVVVAGLVVVVVFGLYVLSCIVVHSILVEIRTTEPITTLINSSDENRFGVFEQSRAPRKYPRANFNADIIGF